MGAPPARSRAGVTVGIAIVSIVMALSLFYSWVVLGFGSDYVCQAAQVVPKTEGTCLDRYTQWWAILLGIHGAAIVAAIILWVRPRTRIWGIVVGILATVAPAAVFTVAYRVPL
jgi:hypothetical protein